MWKCESVSCSVMSNSLWPRGLKPASALLCMEFSRKNTGMRSHSLLQGIFSTQGLNPSLLHCRQILYHPSYQGSQFLCARARARVCVCVCVCVCVSSSVAQSCLTLCDPMDCSLPGSSVRGILQVRILEWVAMPSVNRSSNAGIDPRSSTLHADSLLSEPPGKPFFALGHSIIPAAFVEKIVLSLLNCHCIYVENQ